MFIKNDRFSEFSSGEIFENSDDLMMRSKKISCTNTDWNNDLFSTITNLLFCGDRSSWREGVKQIVKLPGLNCKKYISIRYPVTPLRVRPSSFLSELEGCWSV